MLSAITCSGQTCTSQSWNAEMSCIRVLTFRLNDVYIFPSQNGRQ